MKNKFLLILLSITVAFQSCKDDNLVTYDCTGLAPTYTTDIKPIFDASCAISGCHNASSAANGINLSTYSGSLSANSTSILGSIEHKSGYRAMPESAAQLSTTSRQKIYCWVQNGRPN